jgi:hypothetical protein
VAEIGVVHLVRRKNGLAPFERFLASYQACPAGVPHDLVLIFKGFTFGSGTQDYDRLLVNVPHRRMYLADYGFDLRPYFKAVAILEHRYLCFFNSFSRVLEKDWLAKLYRWASVSGVGAVGATASYQSFRNPERDQMLQAMSMAARLRWRINHVFTGGNAGQIVQRGAAWLLGEAGLWNPEQHFPPFPNYHLRTNAFMATRETLARVRIGSVFFKMSAFKFESGHDSFTNQLMSFGLRPVLVGRDGTGYEKENWHQANIFRQGEQENLLVADNQTDLYARSDAAFRAELSAFAWREMARPA